jgi:hypothetical protein
MPESETAQPMSPLDARDWIQILFKEYDTLRAEILARVANAYQLHSIAGGLIGLLLTGVLATAVPWKVITLPIGMVVVLWVALWLGLRRVILRCAARLREIEGTINELAGADLLRWETHWGDGGIGGHFGQPRRLPLKSLTREPSILAEAPEHQDREISGARNGARRSEEPGSSGK